MSLHFDLVIVCDLRIDTPTPCIELLHWLSDNSSTSQNQPHFQCFSEGDDNLKNVFNHPFLASKPDEEVISVFQKRYRYTQPATVGGGDVYHHALQFSARGILDDYFYEVHLLFVDWLATIAEDGFIGYYKEEYDRQPTLLYTSDRKLVIE